MAGFISSSASSLLLLLISTLSLRLLQTTSSESTFPTKITLSLTPSFSNPHNKLDSTTVDPLQALNSLAASSLSRAKHLKSPKTAPAATTAPLHPRSYGGYSVSLAFGTPPQAAELVFDTGSSLVWVPCTSRYLCSRCAFPNVDPARIAKFIPKLSSTSRIISCANPKCAWVFDRSDTTCNDHNATKACPAYIIQYGSGSTAGLLLSESLEFPGGGKFANFLLGCSFLSIRQPSGIAGFGRGRESLPSQLGLAKFSHCLVSHRFDDEPFSSDLVLHKNDDESGGGEGGGISYTPFQKNPSSARSAFREYYYLMLRRVIVGGERVRIPYKYLEPGSGGDGGTIVDSGSTFTYMERPVHEAVAGEFARQMSKYKRAREVENVTGLMPCFDLSKEKDVNFPGLVLQFKGGAKMELPLPNYFSLVSSSGVACLTVVSDGGAGPAVSGGPAIILGNYQQMDFHVEYDLKNERFGFRRQTCKK